MDLALKYLKIEDYREIFDWEIQSFKRTFLFLNKSNERIFRAFLSYIAGICEVDHWEFYDRYQVERVFWGFQDIFLKERWWLTYEEVDVRYRVYGKCIEHLWYAIYREELNMSTGCIPDDLKPAFYALTPADAQAVYKELSKDDASMLMVAGGMTGDKYRVELMYAIQSYVQDKAITTDPKAILIVIAGLSTFASNLERSTNALQNCTSTVARHCYAFLRERCTQYVADKGKNAFPFVKVQSCVADFAFLGRMMILHRAGIDLDSLIPAGTKYIDASPHLHYQGLGNFDWDQAMQDAHKEFEKDLWDNVIQSTKNAKRDTTIAFSFHEEYYKNTAADKFRFLLTSVTASPYTEDSLRTVLGEYKAIFSGA